MITGYYLPLLERGPATPMHLLPPFEIMKEIKKWPTH